MTMSVTRRLATAVIAATVACTGPALAQDAPGPIRMERLADITRTLASNEFEGRAPGTVGEAKTIEYLVAQFKAAGLEPAGPQGAYTQVVPLVRTQVPVDAAMSVTVKGERRVLVQQKDMAALALRPVDRVTIAGAPLVFVGYGVTAPERQWDDYKGADLKGKVAVFLVNDPDFEAQPGDDAYGRFAGKAATYYARWTYKYEEAVRRGAIAALIVHETEPAAYGWNTAIAPNGEGYDIVRPDPAAEKLLLQSWLHRDTAVEIFRKAGLDFEQLKRAARSKSFKPVPLPETTFAADFPLAHARIDSHNVLGRITGARRPLESVMVGAHWDAYGRGEPDKAGDPIRHGAADDAIGIAGTIEIARALAQGPRPDRTVVFAAWTAEERGLLGSEYYARHPWLPLEKTVANFTMDVLQTAGPARDVVLVGAGQSDLDDLLRRTAARQSRTITPDPRPERGLAFRADHFPLQQRGVPALLLMGMSGGHDLVDGGREAGDRWVSEYTANCYHQACDNWSEQWDLRGAVKDVELVYDMTRELANSNAWPRWNDGTEFKQVRESSAAQRK
ncbi:MAG TPA: M28 family metallopeptidase [Steroidobacteraceae bacterium]